MFAPDHAVSLARPVFAKGSASAADPAWDEYPIATENFGAALGLSAADAPRAIEPVLVVPRFVREIIAAQEHGASDKAPNLTIAQWLHAQPPAVQRRERLRALRKLGLVAFLPQDRQPMRDDGRNALRQLLELGPSDQRARERDALSDEIDAAIAARSTSKAAALATKLAVVTKVLQAAAVEQRAAMQAALERAESASDDEMRVARLLDAFIICALEEVVAHDDFADHETARRAVEYKHRIVAALDAIPGGGRTALERLLENPFAGVRASAGAHLLNAGLRRERVVPMLLQIEKDIASSAGWTAFWALAPDDHGAWLDDGI